MKQQNGLTKTGRTIWLFGLPCSGKTTISKELIDRVKKPVELLDGDEIRENLSNLGFNRQDRINNIKRIRWVCNLLNRNGINVIVSVITPYEEMRVENKKSIENYVGVWVKSSLETCIKRDVKGLYKKALNGEITNMTGIQDPFDDPKEFDIICDTEIFNVKECVDMITLYLYYNQYKTIKI